MTGSEFRNYVVRKFKRTDKDTELYEAVRDIISDMRLQLKLDDDRTEGSLTALTALGEYALDVPIDFSSLIGKVTLIDNATGYDYVLSKTSKDQYDQLTSDRFYSSTDNMWKGSPTHFCVFGNQILLYPIPDKLTYQYKISYTADALTDITSGTAVVPFTDKYRNILRSGVLAELYNGMEQFEEANFWQSSYTAGLQKIYLRETENRADDDAVQYHGV